MNRLVVFLRAPRLGQVKSRIAATVGEAAALRIYERLVSKVLGNLASLPDLELRFTPDDARDEIWAWIRPGWNAAAQGGGDLGQRMLRAFETHFNTGARRVVVIGSDSPDVNAEDVREAWKALEDHEVVLGPACDGGYWLIGLRRPEGALFEGMEWSNHRVLAETLRRAEARRLSCRQLRMLRDIDTVEDWRAWTESRVSNDC